MKMLFRFANYCKMCNIQSRIDTNEKQIGRHIKIGPTELQRISNPEKRFNICYLAKGSKIDKFIHDTWCLKNRNLSDLEYLKDG